MAKAIIGTYCNLIGPPYYFTAIALSATPHADLYIIDARFTLRYILNPDNPATMCVFIG